MPDVTLYGIPQSTYVRSCRMVLAEKEVEYWLDPVGPGSDALARLHPFGRIPAFAHGELSLFETMAIARYVDEAFDGPPLQPESVYARAVMTQWMSAVVDSVYPALMRDYLLHYAMAELRGTEPNRERIDAAVPYLEGVFAVLDRALAETRFLAGDELSLADLMLFPIIHYMKGAPEASKILATFGNLVGWSAGLEGRGSASGTLPPPMAALRGG
jgi:glutathione S-transferase